MAMYGPVMVTDEETGEKVPLIRRVNTMKFKESSEVDGTLVNEIKLGKNGTSLKLADRQKALQWLSDYFLANPMDRHKIEYDKRRMELELTKAKSEFNEVDNIHPQDDGFLSALDGVTTVWETGDDSQSEWDESGSNDADE